jgi:hypothetical protein
MKISLRILSLVTLFTIQMNFSFADRGVTKKKNKVVLNIKSPNSFKSSLNFNLKNGLKYTGSLMTNSITTNPTTSNYLVTYQKGNSVYILPYKQKIFVADIRQGYTGTKLIIRVH